MAIVAHALSIFYPPMAIISLTADAMIFIHRNGAVDNGLWLCVVASLVNIYWTLQSCCGRKKLAKAIL